MEFFFFLRFLLYIQIISCRKLLRLLGRKKRAEKIYDDRCSGELKYKKSKDRTKRKQHSKQSVI
eukprot:snap_masked-scaffold_24-processed-gene-5.9-mRNA-1 protein AED:1.00 eAED:1.00 QI:0/0/0/0/1/1/3/0/63